MNESRCTSMLFVNRYSDCVFNVTIELNIICVEIKALIQLQNTKIFSQQFVVYKSEYFIHLFVELGGVSLIYIKAMMNFLHPKNYT